MTEDLVKRLREAGGRSVFERELKCEAADALEAQAKRIAELEVECSTPRTNTLRRLFGELTARAEKDEADLAAARAALVRWTATAVPGCSDWEIIAAAAGIVGTQPGDFRHD